jgi:hypothetical protein
MEPYGTELSLLGGVPDHEFRQLHDEIPKPVVFLEQYLNVDGLVVT